LRWGRLRALRTDMTKMFSNCQSKVIKIHTSHSERTRSLLRSADLSVTDGPYYSSALRTWAKIMINREDIICQRPRHTDLGSSGSVLSRSKYR
jgi:hypothetical protein